MERLKIVGCSVSEDALVAVPNCTIADPRLSLEALGTLTRALDKPAEWDFSEEAIREEFGLSAKTAARIIRELEDSGYLFREIIQHEDGTWKCNAILYEASQLPIPSVILH